MVMLVISIVFGAASLGGPENVPWTVYETDTFEGKYGLKELEQTIGSGDPDTFAYDDALCTSAACEDCQEAGDATLSFVAIGLIANLVALALCYKRYSDGSTKFLVWATAFGTAGAYFVAWSTWLGGCDQKIKDAVDDSGGDKEDVQPNAGFALVFVGSVLAGLSGLANLISGNWA